MEQFQGCRILGIQLMSVAQRVVSGTILAKFQQHRSIKGVQWK